MILHHYINRKSPVIVCLLLISFISLFQNDFSFSYPCSVKDFNILPVIKYQLDYCLKEI